MTFTLGQVREAIAGVLKRGYPEYEVYGSPNQQGTEPPCFFLFFLPGSKPVEQIGTAVMREIGTDIVFVQEANILNAYQKAEEVADYLDTELRCIPYNGTFLHSHEREWDIEDELHYKFKLKERIRTQEADPGLQEIEGYHGGIK